MLAFEKAVTMKVIAELDQESIGHRVGSGAVRRTQQTENDNRVRLEYQDSLEFQVMRYDTAIPIGEGGMGEVFKAWDPDLKRFVALKVLRHMAPEMVERLLREARIQAQVDHPAVCEVYEVGEDDGRPYIAMEYVEGPLLSEAAPSLTLEQKVLVIQRVADAVQAAHTKGLVHRDLKPSNVILGRDESDELRPYVLDFGLAREQAVSGLTQTGQILGTPGYLSPEQAREASTFDRRSDVFSLGVILYELLAGSLPFPGDSTAEILVGLLERDPKPLRQLAPGVPVELETVVMKCLEKDPDRRYGSARELADDLARFLAGEPVAARPAGSGRRLVRLVRRYRTAAAALVFSSLVLLGAGGYALHTRWTARRSALAAQRFGQEVERIEGLLQRAYLTPLHDLRPEIAAVRERMAWIEEEMKRLGEPSRVIGHYALGRGHLELGETRLAREHLQEAWRGGYHEPYVAYALGTASGLLYRAELERIATLSSAELRDAQRRRARVELRGPAFRYLSSARYRTEHPEYVAASLAFFRGDVEGALAELRAAREREPWFYEIDLLAGDLHAERYRAAAESGLADAAREAFDRAEAAYTSAVEIGRSDPRGYVGLCVLWSEALRHRFHGVKGNLQTVRAYALHHCRKALMANPELLTPHLRMARTECYQADLLIADGKEPAAALEAARGHLQMALELAPEDPEPHVLLGVTYRVEANWRAGRGEDPTPLLRRALDSYARAAELDPRYTSAHLSRALAELYIGDHLRRSGGDPEPHFERALEAGRRTVELEPRMAGGHVNLGIAYGQLAIHRRDQGEDSSELFEQGAAELRKAIELNPGFYTAHFNLGELLVEWAELALRQGRDPSPFVEEATAYLERSIAAWPDWDPPEQAAERGRALIARWKSRESSPEVRLDSHTLEEHLVDP